MYSRGVFINIFSVSKLFPRRTGAAQHNIKVPAYVNIRVFILEAQNLLNNVALSIRIRFSRVTGFQKHPQTWLFYSALVRSRCSLHSHFNYRLKFQLHRRIFSVHKTWIPCWNTVEHVSLVPRYISPYELNLMIRTLSVLIICMGTLGVPFRFSTTITK